jgi:hypothetical protein
MREYFFKATAFGEVTFYKLWCLRQMSPVTSYNQDGTFDRIVSRDWKETREKWLCILDDQ